MQATDSFWPHVPPGPTEYRVEQAIFTSLRTVMGEGYRLVGYSSRTTAEERAEITRRSPSHGSICNPDPAATALASYRLATGRHCVGWSRYAGKEHTARGGFRVHTHIVVLDPAAFRTFESNPFQVHAAQAKTIGDVPDLRPGLSLSQLILTIDPADSSAIDEPDRDIQQQARKLADMLLVASPILATTNHSPIDLLRWTMTHLSPARREELSFSADLHYAASRALQLICVNTVTPDERRAIQGRDIRIIDLSSQLA